MLKKDKKQKNSSKRIRDFIGILVIVLIICFVFFGVGFCIYKSGKLGDAELAYMGSIVSGGLTLLGVIITIMITIELQKDDLIRREEERKDNLSIEYKPILQIEEKRIEVYGYEIPDYKYDVDEDGEPYISVIEEYIDYKVYVDVRLMNIGRGEITKGIISCRHKDTYFDVDYKKNFMCIYQGDSLKINFSIELNNYENLVEQMYTSKMIIDIEYYDCVQHKAKIQIPYYIENLPPTYDYDEEANSVIKISENSITCSVGEIIRNVAM